MTLTYGSLFSGVGGMDLGFDRAGMQCVFQVEKDPYARRVLEKHWPDVRRWDDVCTFPPEPASDWGCDVLCGGFPCQDISYAGKGLGLAGERSGLWFEFARIIRILRPRFVVVENVAALLGRGIGDVLGDLAACGYDAEWSIISACAFGAPHTRERLFIIAYPNRRQLRASRASENKAKSTNLFVSRTGGPRQVESWWATQSEPCSVVYGVPGIVDEIRPYGNAIVPQIAEWIGKRIMESA